MTDNNNHSVEPFKPNCSICSRLSVILMDTAMHEYLRESRVNVRLPVAYVTLWNRPIDKWIQHIRVWRVCPWWAHQPTGSALPQRPWKNFS